MQQQCSYQKRQMKNPLWNFFFAIYVILQVIRYIHFLWNTESLSSWPHIQSIQYQQPDSIDVLLNINESSQLDHFDQRGNLFPFWGIFGNDHLHLLWNPLTLYSMQNYMKGGNGSTRAINAMNAGSTERSAKFLTDSHVFQRRSYLD